MSPLSRTDLGASAAACSGQDRSLSDPVSVGIPVLINEVRFGRTSTDHDEYLGLTGAPRLSLDGLTLLVTGGRLVRGDPVTLPFSSGSCVFLPAH